MNKFVKLQTNEYHPGENIYRLYRVQLDYISKVPTSSLSYNPEYGPTPFIKSSIIPKIHQVIHHLNMPFVDKKQIISVPEITGTPDGTMCSLSWKNSKNQLVDILVTNAKITLMSDNYTVIFKLPLSSIDATRLMKWGQDENLPTVPVIYTDVVFV